MSREKISGRNQRFHNSIKQGDKEAMSSSEMDLFTNKFALYLVSGLLGPSKVTKYLNDVAQNKQPAVPLYWRSNIMIPDASKILYHGRGNTDSTSQTSPSAKILFFDATFHFLKKESTEKPPSCHIMVSLGFFLLLQKGVEGKSNDRNDEEFIGGHYVPTEVLDYEQILYHINSLQLDPSSVTPDALARSMVEEFRRQEFSSDVTTPEEMPPKSNSLNVNYMDIDNSSSRIQETWNTEVESKVTPNHKSPSFVDSPAKNNNIIVEIPYRSIGDSSGKFSLNYSPGAVSRFDRSALKFLSWDISKNPNHVENSPGEDESLLSKKAIIDDAFDQWQVQSLSRTKYDNDDNRHDNCRPESKGNASAEFVASMQSNGTKTNDRHKKRRKGMGILPSARRKRNKGLVYDSK